MPEVDADESQRRSAGMAGKSLTEIFLHYIVLRDRMAASRDRRGRMGPFTHLENCTGKDELKAKFASIQSERRERVLQTFPDGGRSDKATSQTEKDQARKSTGRMPWHRLPKKDAANCEKPWGAVSRHRSRDLRMGKPGRWKERSLSDESIV